MDPSHLTQKSTEALHDAQTKALSYGHTEVAERASVPVVVDLWAPWCGPCRMVSPALAQVATDMAARLRLVKVNVDDSPRLQQRFAVQSIPTLLVMREGKVTSRQVGAAPTEALRSWVEQALAAWTPV
jgi:thioredoxin 2